MWSRPGQPASVQPAESGNTAGEGSLRGARSGQHQPTRTDNGQRFAKRHCGSVDAQRQPGPVSEQREAAGAFPGRLFLLRPAREAGRDAKAIAGQRRMEAAVAISAPVVFSIGEKIWAGQKGNLP
jgi:hypothetical protein